jgi:hypothetical protein
LFLEIPTLEITTPPLQEVTWEGEPVRGPDLPRGHFM